MSAKEELKEIYTKKFGPSAAKKLDAITASDDKSYVETALAQLSKVVGENMAKKYLKDVIEKYC